MSEPKVFEFAKEIGLETLALMDKLREWKIPVKSHMAALDEDTISAIMDKLSEESSSKKKKTKTKTKAKKKKTAKKTTTSAKSSKKVTKKKAAGKKVIRRKASNVPSAIQAEERARKEAEKVASEEAARAAEAGEVVEGAESSPTKTEETGAKVAAVAATEVPRPEPRKRQITGKNIVGKIDLEKARRPPGARSNDRGPSQNRGGASGARTLRTGFVKVDSAKMPFAAPEPLNQTSRRDDKKRKVAAGPPPKATEGGATKEEAPPAFAQTEFRKREVLFQPKKKKLALNREAKKTQITQPSAHKRIVKMNGKITVAELAKSMSVKGGQLMSVLVKNGVQIKMTDEMDFDTVSLIAPEFNYEVQNVEKTVETLTKDAAFGDLDASKVSRPPIVTVMGHVDHGKTSLLDAIRKTNVVKGEAGGITQHIGAYSVKLGKDKRITFIDTPGHQAFTQMRARGANVTDIAIIVVAADDGVMPQTEEAISHAKAAEVPIIVAVNKMDRPGANFDKIKQQMMEYELVSEEWGGTTIFAPVAAINGEGIEDLLESVYLVAEMGELNANPKRSGTGIVIEAEVKKGRGNVATLLVQDGSIEVGQYIVAGKSYGRVRAMMNDLGQKTKKAMPSDPVEVLGLETTPLAGDRFDVCKTESIAKEIAEKREEEENKTIETPNSSMSLEDLFANVKTGDVKELPVVIKTDVAGTGEAIKGMLDKIHSDEVKVKVVHSAVGGISESDVLLANTANGMIIGFNVRPDGGASRLAKQSGIEIKTYSVVYELIEDIEKAMKGMLAPKLEEKSLGHLEVREIFSVPKMGVIAGCFVTDGKINRNALVRLVRDGRTVYEGKVGSLRRFKDDAKEVASGYECGVGIENYNDVKVGDVIESYEIVEVAHA